MKSSAPIDQIDILLKRAFTLHRQGNLPQALDMLQRVLTIDSDEFTALHGMGVLFGQLGHHNEALRFLTTAVAVQPDNFAVHYNRGKALHQLRRYDEALASYDVALSLRPDFSEAYGNRGNTLRDMNRHKEALASYDKAIALKPDCAEAYANRGIVLRIMDRYEDALDNFTKAIAIKPSCALAYGHRLTAQMHIGLWNDFEHRVKELIELVDQDILASEPFTMLAIPATSGILQKNASRYITDKYLPVRQSLYQGERYGHDRIRIGYFSADFRNHPVSYLMAELFEKHDRSRFEIFAFSFGPGQKDEMRARLVKAFDHFLDVSQKSDQATAALARKMEIDIAIDLMGFTRDARPGIFALRPAPIQVSYLGYPGTMGAPFIDYIIADPVVIPKEHFEYYTEKIVHLPHCYVVNDSQRRIADTVPARSSLGLPETGFVFCCFNNNFKVTPDVFTIWMGLLSKVTGSVLWLLEGNATIQRNLRREAQERNINPERLIFAPRISSAEHLARLRQADLFLDTFYYNAGSTACDALWAGLPVLTCLGNTFVGRAAASLLYAVGLSELVTHSHEEYESLALRLATNPDLLAIIKHKLAQNRSSYPLFNSSLITQHIESAYTTMWRHSQQGLAPDHIYLTQ